MKLPVNNWIFIKSDVAFDDFNQGLNDVNSRVSLIEMFNSVEKCWSYKVELNIVNFKIG